MHGGFSPGTSFVQHVGYTPLHKAAFGGHTEVIKILINAGADLEIKNTVGTLAVRTFGHTSLMCCAC